MTAHELEWLIYDADVRWIVGNIREEQRDDIVSLCRAKIAEYVEIAEEIIAENVID